MDDEVSELADFLSSRRQLFVLTGAGCSTESGIPDYRDRAGDWKHRQPMTYQQFTGSAAARRRYWTRSFVGWRRIAEAEPNAAHLALARLENAGRVGQLLTQNVDRLHAKAGSRRVVDLHGRLDRVECLDCRVLYRRDAFQDELERLNPSWGGTAEETREVRPDGDVELTGVDEAKFRVPACPRCGGVLKPAVVFFGESVPRRRVERAFAALDAADGLLAVGSSLMVFSGYRFVRGAKERGVSVALLNLGKTRADDEADLKVEGRCGEVLPRVLQRLGIG